MACRGWEINYINGAQMDTWNVPFSSFYNPSQSRNVIWVSNLMNSSGTAWNSQLINEVFNLKTTKHILAIPLSLFPKEDKILWHYERHRIYIVKSGYKLAYLTATSTSSSGLGNPSPNSIF